MRQILAGDYILVYRNYSSAYPKNPLIQQFFANIGRTDTIGSGVRNLHLSIEQVMAELDISRAMVFRDYVKIKKVTGAMYDKKTSTWTL